MAGGHLVEVSGQHGGFATAGFLDQSVGSHGADRLVGRGEHGQWGQVTDTAVTEVTHQHQLLEVAGGLQDAFLGQEFGLDQGGSSLGIQFQAFPDPADECLVNRVAFANSLSTAVGDFHHRFFHDQTVGGVHGVGPSAEVLVTKREDVQRWIEGSQRQPETGLARGGPVAGARIAATLGERCQHFVLEADRVRHGCVLDGHLHGGLLAADGRRQHGCAITSRQGFAVLDLDHLRVGRGETRHRGQVANLAGGVFGRHQQLLERPLAREFERCGFENQPGWFAHRDQGFLGQCSRGKSGEPEADEADDR